MPSSSSGSSPSPTDRALYESDQALNDLSVRLVRRVLVDQRGPLVAVSQPRHQMPERDTHGPHKPTGLPVAGASAGPSRRPSARPSEAISAQVAADRWSLSGFVDFRR
jgi:hypothetical protein